MSDILVVGQRHCRPPMSATSHRLRGIASNSQMPQKSNLDRKIVLELRIRSSSGVVLFAEWRDTLVLNGLGKVKTGLAVTKSGIVSRYGRRVVEPKSPTLLAYSALFKIATVATK